MTLTADEKTVLQDAIMDGAFSPVIQTDKGIARGAVTGDTLRAIAALSDEEVRVVLRAYQSNVISANANAVNRSQADIANIQKKTTALQALVITPPPLPVQSSGSGSSSSGSPA